MYHFVYVTTNLLNEKKYIGNHSTHNINDGYLGSGKYFVKAIKKYGKEQFKREILEHFKTKEDAFNSQEKYIKKFNSIEPFGYNLSPVGGTNVANNKITEKHKKNLSKSIKKWHEEIGFSEETKQKIGNSLRGFKHKNTSNYKKGNAQKNKGRKMPEESKKMMIDKLKGQKRSDEIKKKISEGSKKSRVICEYCQKEIPLNIYNKCHGKKCKKYVIQF